jgi:hypothetical protein
MQGPDYKSKYKELRAKYINDLDMAFRLGCEAGAQQAQMQQTLDTQAQMNEQNSQIESGDANLSTEAGSPETNAQENSNAADNMESAQAGGSELDQHINRLEGMLGSDASPEVKKSLDAILSLRKAEKQAQELRKSQAAISGIAKALHKPAFKLGVQASHNLSDNAKKAVSLQHKIVNDVMKSWEEQENKAKNSIENILNIEGLLKD